MSNVAEVDSQVLERLKLKRSVKVWVVPGACFKTGFNRHTHLFLSPVLSIGVEVGGQVSVILHDVTESR